MLISFSELMKHSSYLYQIQCRGSHIWLLSQPHIFKLKLIKYSYIFKKNTHHIVHA